jgi:hypothetical protein
MLLLLRIYTRLVRLLSRLPGVVNAASDDGFIFIPFAVL